MVSIYIVKKSYEYMEEDSIPSAKGETRNFKLRLGYNAIMLIVFPNILAFLGVYIVFALS